MTRRSRSGKKDNIDYCGTEENQGNNVGTLDCVKVLHENQTVNKD